MNLSSPSAVSFPVAAAVEAARLCNASYAADVVAGCAALPIPYDAVPFGGDGPARGFLAKGGGADWLMDFLGSKRNRHLTRSLYCSRRDEMESKMWYYGSQYKWYCWQSK